MMQMETVSISSSDNTSSNQSNVVEKNKHSTQVDAVTSASHTESSSGGMSSSWISFIISCIIMLILSSIIGYYFYSNPGAATELKSKVKNVIQKLPKKV